MSLTAFQLDAFQVEAFQIEGGVQTTVRRKGGARIMRPKRTEPTRPKELSKLEVDRLVGEIIARARKPRTPVVIVPPLPVPVRPLPPQIKPQTAPAQTVAVVQRPDPAVVATMPIPAGNTVVEVQVTTAPAFIDDDDEVLEILLMLA